MLEFYGGVIEPSVSLIGRRKPQPDFRVSGIRTQRLDVVFDGVGELALARQRVGESVMRGGIIRLHGERGLKERQGLVEFSFVHEQPAEHGVGQEVFFRHGVSLREKRS